MKCRFLFEFMDESWLPNSLTTTIRETLNVMLSKPFRGYYDEVAAQTIEIIRRDGVRHMVELGAGTAPISRQLAMDETLPKLVKLSPSDNNPDLVSWRLLEASYPDIVESIKKPVDFGRPLEFEKGTLLVLSATFHHIPIRERESVLKHLISHKALICEPVRRSYSSLLFTLLGIIPALLAPLALINRSPGHLRRILWCWVIPLAPIMIVWDGIASCFRCWTDQEWIECMNRLAPSLKIKMGATSTSSHITW